MGVALIGHRTLTQGSVLMADIPVLSAADQAKADKAKADKAKPDVKADEKGKEKKAKEQKPAAEGGAAAPGRKKLFIMIAIGVVVLGGAGAGGWFMFAGKHADAAKTTAAKGKPGTTAPKAEKEEPAPTGPSIYVALDPPFVVNFESEQLVRFLQVTAQVMTRDPETAELLKANDPMIRNDMLLLLGNQTYATVSTREGKEKLRAGALDTVRNVVKTAGGKPKNVEAVFFTSFVMQ